MASTFALKNKMDDRLSLKVDYFRAKAMKTQPHKHRGYFEIIYLLEGEGAHFIDSVKYEVGPQAIYFIRKEQVHHWDLTDTPKGYVILVKKRFVDGLLDGELKQLFGKLSSHNCLRLQEAEVLPQLLELLLTEAGTGELYQAQVLEGLLKAFFAKVLQYARPTEKIPLLRADAFQSFLELLSINGNLKRPISYYAQLLNTTPQNLNNICRKAADRPAAAFIADYILSEARRRLLYTGNTVAETAFALGFKDPSHFVKYFKRLTGSTPQVYRSSCG